MDKYWNDQLNKYTKYYEYAKDVLFIFMYVKISLFMA